MTIIAGIYGIVKVLRLHRLRRIVNTSQKLIYTYKYLLVNIITNLGPKSDFSGGMVVESHFSPSFPQKYLKNTYHLLPLNQTKKSPQTAGNP